MSRFGRLLLVFAFVAAAFVGGVFALAAIAGTDWGTEVTYGPMSGFAVVGVLVVTLTALVLFLAVLFAVMDLLARWVNNADH